MEKKSEIAIVGRACRLPGANSVSGLWDLLSNRKCAITRIPADRWSLERFSHPRHSERGRSYTWAAGILDDVWGFDPGAFGLSPREAEQMDPQQRLLLELTWEALEDAGIPPSSLAGTETGVFVGASTLDHGNSKLFDFAATDAYFATGNAASILANRVSYVFDLNGPSFTVDTACSSSLVALDAAVQALQSGRIDTAVVGGVSILLAPFQFVSFSQASMLSRVGLCQAFSARADGYVRSEGGAVVVLRRAQAMQPGRDRAHAVIQASRVNSDGRTNGIALPSKLRQAQLLDQIYGEGGPDANRLAFVEAHGTGTPVGDPVEATALGEVLGRKRAAPLLIGSVKSNIGHTEAAAGLAGLIKATLALQHDLLPPTLHCDDLNPNIDFERLNLRVARDAVPLARTDGPRLAGVSSYGFGGTNTHVVVADAPAAATSPAADPPALLMLSAHTRGALAALARDYADRFEAAPDDAMPLAAAANRRRDALPERLAIPLDGTPDLPAALRAFAEGGEAGPGVAAGTAVARHAKVAFVFSGNGSQWVGMGRAAFRSSEAFRDAFGAVDALFQALAGWSLEATLNADDLADQLGKTSVAQPLIFAIQAAATRVLKGLGLKPDVVLGHSVGEVAAAEAAGALDLAAAVKVIYHRSHHQEQVAGHGGMAVLIGSREAAETLVARIPNLSVAAYNSPRTTTVSGSAAALDAFAGEARGLKVKVQRLDIPYPFHSALIEPIRDPLLNDLGAVPARDGAVTFVSTVTGAALPGSALDSTYWWRNIREPVLFADAVEAAAQAGARVFVEIGPSPILLSLVNDTLGARDLPFATLPTLERRDGDGDPFRRALAVALSRGAAVEAEAVLGTASARDLPAYPWQKKPYRLGETAESAALLSPRAWHPLTGARTGLDQLEWHGTLDTSLVPALADHVVDGHVLLPGAGFAEMALAVARDWLGSDAAGVADFEIHAPLILDGTTSRETRCRIQPVTGTLEIMSRPRLAAGAWQVHVTAKVLRYVGKPDGPGPVPAGAPAMTGADLYPAAAASGLQYGPAFRLLDAVRRTGPRSFAVDLLDSATDARYGLDPARVDACFHGLVVLFADLAVRGHLKPYVPVAVAEAKLFRPGARIARAFVDVRRADERVIVVDFTLVDAGGEPVARLYGARFQAMNAFRAADRTIEFIGAKTLLAAEPLAVHEEPGPTAARVAEAALSLGRAVRGEAAPGPDYVLLEGWATAAGFGLAEVLAVDGQLDLGAAVETGRLPAGLRDWCARLVAALGGSGLVSRTEPGVYRVSAGVDLPDPRDVLRTLAAEHPERSAELLLAARAGAVIDALADGSGAVPEGSPYTVSAVDAFDYGGRTAVEAADMVGAVLDRLDDDWPRDRALRVLQVGDGPLSAVVAALAATRSAELTIVEPDRRRLERARLALDGYERVTVLAGLDGVAAGSVDLVVAAHTLHRAVRTPADRAALAAVLAPGATLLAVEPEVSLFRDLVFGLAETAADGEPDAPPVRSDADWRRAVEALGLADATVLPAADASLGLLVTAQKPAERAARTFGGDALVVAADGPLGGAAAALATMLKFSGLKVASAAPAEVDAAILDGRDTIILLAQEAAGAAPADRIARRCLGLQRLALALGTRKARLWLVCPGATRSGPRDGDPVEAAVWAFARTLANEVQTLEVRLIDLVPDLSADVAARRLRDVVLSDTTETEIVLDASGTAVLRFERVSPPAPATAGPADTVLRLAKGEHGGLDRMIWAPEARRAPGPGEVELAVDAAGLNFRDVMWGLSILPEEILEDGYAGATLGLECAGRVVRVGEGVTRLKVGDPVLAFAKAALATHVTVDAAVAAPIPDGLPVEAAATVPVAFLTAFYGLIRCARLAEDEWVLIHGGAGGVGLAALQIALWRGARVIATAGSDERRDLLTALGADHVFDSRSSAFVDDIRRVTGSGVDVVLNSLSGEAMERSIAVLKPFGRFVELGKRDYVANTHIGLKPFRRNLSYFGVDLDQLILKGDGTGEALFADVMRLFADGALSPLPYRVFPARDTVDAFRVMQRSGHVGKIVILPPPLPAGDRSAAVVEPFAVAPDRTHLVTGGLRGFGLETARWLVARGARHLVLLGRSGASEPEAAEAMADFAAAGVEARAEAVDVTDAGAMDALLARLDRSMPPLGGVVHAATVYDDAIVANLTPEKLGAVLRAKVAGADNLDRLTRGRPLVYFILYSSATTLIGNPGQGAYVAANAYLEGLARRRRAEGLPGFAAAWGAIGDVGVLARSTATATTLLNRTGVQGMAARTALDRLAEAMAVPGRSSLAIASVNWSAAREHLPVLRGDVFSSLMHGAQAAEATSQAKIVVRDLVEQQGVENATRTVAEAVQEEIARILRLPREDVSRNKPLLEVGLDSLMAVELGMGLEQRFTLDAPLSTSVSAMTINELADHVVGLGGGAGRGDQTAEDLALRHIDADLRGGIAEAFPDFAERLEAARQESIS